MKKLYLLALILAAPYFSSQILAQNCLQIACPGDTVLNAGATCDVVYNYTTPRGIDTCNPSFFYTFTTCGVTGKVGPTQTQANSAYANTSLNGLVSVTAGIQYFVVPTTATYTISAIGAAGTGSNGGAGARMTGDFSLTAGDTLLIIAGQQGDSPTDNSSTGGGGSWVVKVDNNSSTTMTSTGLKVTPLIIAGGGGGNPGTSNSACDANITTGGNTGVGATGGGAGGTNGNGGTASVTSGNNRGGGGGGFLTDGDRTGTCGGTTAGDESGSSFLNGGVGGENTGCSTPYEGGFGGGGGSNSSGWRGSGGGGGYSGGGAGQTNSNASTHRGGGGGSFNSGTNKFDSTGVGTGAGYVILELPGNPTITTRTTGIGSGGLFPLGLTTETYVVTDGVDSATCSFTVTVIDTPATSIDPFPFAITCTSSDTIPLPAAYPPGGSYSGPGVTGSDFNPAIAGAGSHWIKYTDVVCPMTDSTMITVQNLPATSLSPFAQDSICDISNPIPLPSGTPTGGVYTGSGVSGTNFDPSVSGLGEVWITYTYTNCQSSDSTSIYVLGCTGIDDLNSTNALSISPNPSNGIFKLENNGMPIIDMKIYNSVGKIILDYSDNLTVNSIDLSDHSKGIYILTIRTKTGLESYRLIKE